jgi:hypothetical protein
MTPWCSAGAPARGPRREEDALEADHRGQREGRVRAVRLGHREAQEHEADGREGQAPPLPAADLVSEDAIGHDGNEHDAARQDDLDDRQRGERDRRDVQRPRGAADAHADREPLRAPQTLRRPQRVANVDGGRLAATAVLEEEPEVRSEGAQKRQQNAEMKRHAELIGPGRSTHWYRPMTW